MKESKANIFGDIPFLHDVTKTFTGEEAFAHAESLYTELVTGNTPSQSSIITKETEARMFAPATKLQFAGLSLVAGRPLGVPDIHAVSLACFSVDHLLWGWKAAVHANIRVAFTLVRAAVEASIFEIASATLPAAFQKKWNTPGGTGGSVLKDLENSRKVNPRVLALSKVAWGFTVAFGHASHVPVYASAGTANTGANEAKTISFAGQYAGPISAEILEKLSNTYSLASIVAVEAMNIAVLNHMTDKDKWQEKYIEFVKILHSTMSPPEDIRTSLDNEFKQNNK